jgi:hypothetical protein
MLLYSNLNREAIRLGQLYRDALSHARSTPKPAARVPQRVIQRLGKETTERIVAEYTSGTSTTLLAKRYGFGKGTILRLIRDSGGTLRRRGTRS